MRLVTAPVLALAVLAACSGADVSLTYGSEPGLRVQYTLTLDAEIVRTLGESEPERQLVTATFRAGQEILEPAADGSTSARMSLDPVSLVVDGAPQNVGPGQSFLVTLGEDGEVVTIENASTGETAEPLELVGIERLLPRLRPVLPDGPVGVGDGWSGQTDFDDADGSFSLSTSSRLERLGTAQGHDAALIRTTYTSPVDRREVFANAEADLVGRDVGAQEAWFALDGFLVQAIGDSVGRYRVTFRPPGGDETVAPVEGSLVVSLHTEMTLV